MKIKTFIKGGNFSEYQHFSDNKTFCKTEGFVEEVEESVKGRVFDVVKPYVNIKKSTLDENSGLLGAGYLAFSRTNIK